MNIVITMAGVGSRFRKVGYDIPKYMIEANGKTLFEWSMASLVGFNDIVTQYIFIVRREDNSIKFIVDKCKENHIANFNVIEIDYMTDGQATTTMLASRYWDKKQPLLIYNIDTYVEGYEMNSCQLKGDGFIPCFKGEGDHWSFVRINEDGRATEVREKHRISENCTLGAYYFKTGELYEKLYNEYYKKDENVEASEKYVAPLYNYLIEKGGEVYISSVLKEKVHVLGTPKELNQFIEKCES